MGDHAQLASNARDIGYIKEQVGKSRVWDTATYPDVDMLVSAIAIVEIGFEI